MGWRKYTSIGDIGEKLNDGMTIMVGGFGGVGNPPTLVQYLVDQQIEEITLICNDAAFPLIGVGKLVCNRQVKKLIVSHIGSNPVAGEQMTNGEIEVEFSPQGTLAERIRAAGMGLKGVVTNIGIDNEWVNKEKRTLDINGGLYLLEEALHADVALIYAKKADEFGNLIFDKTARNMNPLMAMAAEFTIAEVDELVPIGELEPEEIITPGVFVDAIVKSEGVNWSWVWE
ncbi:CoA transferase subunit A [Bacillus carboniphilus]|uniref:CoA transferase subunit A n=1 Tax=Bacillus carboniphilus TaxID=86663 RepID=A0ABY9JX00_9BACI|nr:CoA transferase subunit A [Bacillus carboniphilus]WLR43319.1 CoA transferase subunit A [Bacillus carboniphilus]